MSRMSRETYYLTCTHPSQKHRSPGGIAPLTANSPFYPSELPVKVGTKGRCGFAGTNSCSMHNCSGAEVVELFDESSGLMKPSPHSPNHHSS